MSEIETINSQFLICGDEAGNAKIDVRFDGETVWLTEAQIVELTAAATVRELRTVRREGPREVQESRSAESDFDWLCNKIISEGKKHKHLGETS